MLRRQLFSSNHELWIFLLLLTYSVGLWVSVMEVDAAQYASMGREMLERGSYLQLYNRGQDYLDKPPLLFWLVSLSYAVFGVSTVAFKLPSLLFSLLAIYSTYRLGERLHGKTVGFWAAWMLATTQAWFMMNVDPRTDMLLTGSVTFALWQLVAYDHNSKWRHLLLGSTGIGFAMLAKGPIGLMVPGLALGTHWIIRQKWRSIFRWQWLVLLVIVGLIIFPMAYGLYSQFDLHPDKIVYGMTGVSGLKFYFWDQSFGRLTGDNQFINQVGHSQQSNDPFFFAHTFLWSFFPWSWLFTVVIIRKAASRIRHGWGQVQQQEYLTWAGTLLPWIALSFSGYKLPHYIFVFFPLAAILTAKELQSISDKRWITLGQYVVLGLSILAIVILFIWVFPIINIFTWIGLVLILGVIFFFPIRSIPNWLTIGVGSMLLLNWTLNTHFYPTLLTYQVSSHVVRNAEEYDSSPQQLYQWPYVSYNFEFYRRSLQDTMDIQVLASRKAHVLIPLAHWSDFLKQGVAYTTVVDSIPGTRVTRLTVPFLHNKTRKNQVRYWHLVSLTLDE